MKSDSLAFIFVQKRKLKLVWKLLSICTNVFEAVCTQMIKGADK
jgi:hypothetical protein